MPTTDVQRRNVDWETAEAFFLALDPPRRLQRVVEEFSVSRVSVGKQAKKRKWREKAEQIDAHAASGAVRRIAQSRAERVAKVLGLVDAVLAGFDADLDAKIAEAKLSDIPALVKLAELLEGEATDRVDVRKVSAVIVAFLPRFAAGWPKERAGELTVLFDEFEGELAALEAGTEAA